MNRLPWIFIFFFALFLASCGVMKRTMTEEKPALVGMHAMEHRCSASDTVKSILIKKAEALLIYDHERYEVDFTVYSRRDSIIYLSAVNSGFEILRASVDSDSIKVIDRLNKIVYRTPLKRRFGYQNPVSFEDLQKLIDGVYLCDYLETGRDDLQGSILFEFDVPYIKKRIILDRENLGLRIFEFYHQRTDQYIMGERRDNGIKIYSNFMIGDIEISATGGERIYNRDVKIKMEVNPRRYTFTELR
jgi:hypothetical protein